MYKKPYQSRNYQKKEDKILDEHKDYVWVTTDGIQKCIRQLDNFLPPHLKIKSDTDVWFPMAQQEGKAILYTIKISFLVDNTIFRRTL
jgi:hypothetical protein